MITQTETYLKAYTLPLPKPVTISYTFDYDAYILYTHIRLAVMMGILCSVYLRRFVGALLLLLLGKNQQNTY